VEGGKNHQQQSLVLIMELELSLFGMEKAKICVQCGEEWIDNRTAAKLEKISNEVRSKKLQLKVVVM